MYAAMCAAGLCEGAVGAQSREAPPRLLRHYEQDVRHEVFLCAAAANTNTLRGGGREGGRATMPVQSSAYAVLLRRLTARQAGLLSA